MNVQLIPAFNDNYIFAVVVNGSVMIVDPGDAKPVIRFLNDTNLKLGLVTVTHHHHDHMDGAQELASHYKVDLLGPSSLASKGVSLTQVLAEGSEFQFDGLKFEVWHLPGHTLDHLAFWNAEERVVFCGDILFSLGCGRLFEGTAEQQYHSLQRLKALPKSTQIYCAHEYTLKNCEFWQKELPEDAQKYAKIHAEVLTKRAHNLPTVPTPLAFELEANGLLRASTLEEFRTLRSHRDTF